MVWVKLYSLGEFRVLSSNWLFRVAAEGFMLDTFTLLANPQVPVALSRALR
jgi:hypothetical protein